MQHKPKTTENKNENEGSEEVQSDMSHELLDWLQEFRQNLVDESTSIELWRNREQVIQRITHGIARKNGPTSGKHNVSTHV